MAPQTAASFDSTAVQDAAPAASDPVAIGRPDASIWEDCTEVDREVTDIEGTVPKGLRGRLLRNGPGKRSLGTYFWDGDGMVRALQFGEDGARYRSRYVHTKKYLGERGATQPQFRSAGTQRPGGILANAFRMPSPEANTHLLMNGGKLLALHEGSAPYAMDPKTFDTLGLDHFDGALPKTSTFSAHPHTDPKTGDVFNFGMITDAKGTRVRAYRLRPTGKLETIGDVKLPGATFMHDFAVTENWLVFFVPPVRLNMLRMMLGVGSVLDAFHWVDGQATQVFMLSKDGTRTLQFDVEPSLLGHVIVAREQGDDVVIDYVRGPAWNAVGEGLAGFRENAFPFMGEMCLWRLRLNTRTRRVQSEEFNARPADFPRGNETLGMHEQRHIYIAANAQPRTPGMFHSLMKLDMDTGAHELFEFGEDCFTQEPIFVPKPNAKAEDNGWVLQFVHNNTRKKTDCAVFDARKISDGPICTLHLPASAGMTFHGIWTD